MNEEYYPVDTYENVVALGQDPRHVASCSAPTKTNRGCTWFNRCPARAFRDRKEGKAGPANGVFFVQLSDVEGAVGRNVEMPCWMYHTSGLYMRKRDSEETGEIIITRGWEGDGKEYSFTEATHEAHKKANPKCATCADPKARCHAVEEYEVKRKILPFVRAAEMFKGVARGQSIREEMLAEEESVASQLERASGKA